MDFYVLAQINQVKIGGGNQFFLFLFSGFELRVSLLHQTFNSSQSVQVVLDLLRSRVIFIPFP